MMSNWRLDWRVCRDDGSACIIRDRYRSRWSFIQSCTFSNNFLVLRPEIVLTLSWHHHVFTLRAKSRCSLLICGNHHLLVLLTRRTRPVLLLLMCHLSSSVDRSIVQYLLLILLMLRWSQWVGEVICVCCPAYPSVKFKLAHGLLDLLWTKH